MVNRIKTYVISKLWFWYFRSWLVKLCFYIERKVYKNTTSISNGKLNARILGSIAWISIKSLFWVVIVLLSLNHLEVYIRTEYQWFEPLSKSDKEFNLDQLRLYAQLLTAIFSIYFATIGIILSAGYTRLRRDIIRMLTNEQVGSIYSKILIFTAIFSLVATAMPPYDFTPGLLITSFGTCLILLSVLALFPLGQRMFNFFDLNTLVSTEILPSIVNHIGRAANPRNSISLSNHHSMSAQLALDQLFYIDDRIKSDEGSLQDTLPRLSRSYTVLLIEYLNQKHSIDQGSYWFPRRYKHAQWFLVNESTTSSAHRTSSQLTVEEISDYQWLESKIITRLADHIELAFEVRNYDLALELIHQFSTRLLVYTERFHFDVGIKELKIIEEIIIKSFKSTCDLEGTEVLRLNLNIADTWSALANRLCLETLRRMITFEKELEQFFSEDVWSRNSIRRLPHFLQVELAFIIEYIEFEKEVEGKRLSKPKYIRQLTVQKLLQHYSKVLPAVLEVQLDMIPGFAKELKNLKMSEAATQVVLASLHTYWKLPSWFNDIKGLLDRYRLYEHYSIERYKLCNIDVSDMLENISLAHHQAILNLSDPEMIRHILEPTYNDEAPDHFGQIYYQLAESCILAIENNDKAKLDKLFPIFLSLAFQAEGYVFVNPDINISQSLQYQIGSMVVNDLASILGFAILYGVYFNDEELAKDAVSKFDSIIDNAPDKQKYYKRMLMLSNPYIFYLGASPRSLIRMNWKNTFNNRLRNDGYANQESMSFTQMKQHPSNIISEFMRSDSDASHLFLAIHILPAIEDLDIKVDYHITELQERLRLYK